MENRVSFSVNTVIKENVVSFALPFKISIFTKKPSNSFPYDVSITKKNKSYIYVLKFDESDIKRFIKSKELYVQKEENESFEDTMKDIDEKM